MSNSEGGSAPFFRHPLGDFRHLLKVTLPPPGRNPENASAPVGVVSGSEIDPTRLVEALSSFYGNVLVNAYFHGTVRLF